MATIFGAEVVAPVKKISFAAFPSTGFHLFFPFIVVGSTNTTVAEQRQYSVRLFKVTRDAHIVNAFFHNVDSTYLNFRY